MGVGREVGNVDRGWQDVGKAKLNGLLAWLLLFFDLVVCWMRVH